jgi:hypothetical protein
VNYENKWKDNIKKYEKCGVKMWIGFSWFKTGLNGTIMRTM